MEHKKRSILGNGMIWFGAAVSIAEIMTGTLMAPLGFGRGFSAIILGHLIGGILFYLSGLIGARTGRSSMETVKLSFGERGSLLFSVSNVLQLIGWTAVMIIGGARAVGAVLNPGVNLNVLWSILIGVLIIVWILIGIKNLGKVNIITMSALFLVTVVLSFIIFKGEGQAAVTGSISFGSALELSVAMPLSWLPLVSDYTRFGGKSRGVTAVSSITYFAVSSWMYVIGMGAAIFTGQSDISVIMLQAGLGVLAVFIIIASTVTTTFLDVYSAGVSFLSIKHVSNEKLIAVIAAVIGTAIAIFVPIEQYQNFLYLIGSVFAPMFAILITDFFLLKENRSGSNFHISNMLLWAAGFLIYRVMLNIDTPVGSTLPVMIIISILSLLVYGGKRYVRRYLK